MKTIVKLGAFDSTETPKSSETGREVMRRAAAILLTLIAAAAAYAQSGPFTGNVPASVTLTVPGNVTPGSTFTADVNVDLSGINGVCGATTPAAVLNGYAIPISFDPTEVEYVSSAACTAPEFGAPVSTEASTANSLGQVAINAAQPSQTTPSGGPFCVARLTFRALAENVATTLTPHDTELVSAFQSCAGGGSGGPAMIASRATSAVVGLQQADVPSLSTAGLALFAAAIAIAALFALRMHS